jgi:hypothetical protein
MEKDKRQRRPREKEKGRRTKRRGEKEGGEDEREG